MDGPKGNNLTTPVVFLVFNRPEPTRIVFEQIKLAKPSKLLIVADGPRLDHPEDLKRCKSVRDIVGQVDWPCEVLRNYAETNLGCRKRLISGLNWVFDQVPEAIILEDDCLPDSTFFHFGTEMLDRFRHDERIKMISGNNYLFDGVTIPESYYFSNFTHIWGWATWARAWKEYDPNMEDWPALLSANWLSGPFPDRGLRRYWERVFEFAYKGIISTWDMQLNYSSLVHNGMAVVPCVNLVTNIGFGHDATITRTPHRLSEVKADKISFPLVHPKTLEVNYPADLCVARNIYFRPFLPLFLAVLIEKMKRIVS